MKTRGLLGLVCLVSVLAQAAPSTPTDTVWQRARAYRQDALNAQQHAHAQLTPEALSAGLGTSMPATSPNPEAPPQGVMAFVSLTMPRATLTALLRQSAHWQVPLVIRGVLPGGLVATAHRLQALLRPPGEAPIHSGVAINPHWFRQFDIQAVPAFVSVKPGHCLPMQPCRATDVNLVRGNLSLPQALTLLSEGDAGAPARQALKRAETR